MEAHPELSQQAIGSASMDTSGEALIVAVELHAFERSVFEAIDRMGGKWTKDDVLFALEELAVLSFVETTLEQKGNANTLFKFMAQKPKDGGLGWKDSEYIETFMMNYMIVFQDRFPDLNT